MATQVGGVVFEAFFVGDGGGHGVVVVVVVMVALEDPVGKRQGFCGGGGVDPDGCFGVMFWGFCCCTGSGVVYRCCWGYVHGSNI